MKSDRYLKAILTLIALELGWLAFNQTATPVTAQAAPTPVVITGVEMRNSRDLLPVGVVGQLSLPGRTLQPVDMTIRNERVPVSVSGIVDMRPVGAIKIEADKPLKVENVGYTPAQRPGE